MSLTAEQLTELFPGLLPFGTPEDADRLVAWLAPRSLEPGEVLVEQDLPNDSLYLLVSGTVRLQLNAENAELVLGELGPGAWVGELSMLRPGKASATVTAVDACALFSLQHDDFEALRRSWPVTASQLIHTFSLNLVDRLRTNATVVVKRDEEGVLTLHSSDTYGLV